MELTNDALAKEFRSLQLSFVELKKDLEESTAWQERRFQMASDKRLAYFGDGVSGSSGRSRSDRSEVNAVMRDLYGGKCLFCDATEGVTSAHLVASAKEFTFKEFGVANNYVDELKVDSPRNFIPLCGTKGVQGTCHNEFDNYHVTLFYDPMKQMYRIHCLNESFKGGAIHGKELNIASEFSPYRRLLAWRSRRCALANQYLFDGKSDQHAAYLAACNFSEESRSISGRSSED